MKQPFDLDVVDGLLANAMQEAWSGREADADSPFKAEFTALEILVDRAGLDENDYSGGYHVQAGFRLAMRLCCRILADPLRVDVRGVEADILDATKEAELGRQEILTLKLLRAGKRKSAA